MITKDEIYPTPHELVRFAMRIDLNDNAKGNDRSERINSFYKDILSMLKHYGFNIQREADYTAPEAKKGIQRIYCHHLELSGECRPSEYAGLEKMLRSGHTYNIMSIHREKLMDYTKQEELALYHEINGPTIIRDLLKKFDVKGEDTYKKHYPETYEQAQAIKIKTIYNRMNESSDCANHIFVNNAFFKMIIHGMLEMKPKKRGERDVLYVRSTVNLKTLDQNGELLLSVKDKSTITDEMYLTAAKNCYRVLQIFPEHLKTEQNLLPMVQNDGFALQFIEKDKRSRDLCMEAIRTHFDLNVVEHPELINLATRYLQNLNNNPNNDEVNTDIHLSNFMNIAFLIGDPSLSPISEQERTDISYLINTSDHEKAFLKLPDDRKTEVVSYFALSTYPDNLKHIPDKQLTDQMINTALIYDGSAILHLNPERRSNDLLLFALQHCHENDIRSVDVFKLMPLQLSCTKQSVSLALQKSIHAINHVDHMFVDTEMISAVIKRYPDEDSRKVLLQNKDIKLHLTIINSGAIDPMVYIQSIPLDVITPEIACTVIEKDGKCIRHIPRERQTKEMIIAAIANQKDGSILAYDSLNKELIDNNVYKRAIRADPESFRYIPTERITPELCLFGTKYHPDKKEHISTYFPQSVKDGENVYTFNLRAEKEIGKLSAENTIKLYNEGKVVCKTIRTSDGELKDQTVTYNKKTRKLTCKSIPPQEKSQSSSIKNKDTSHGHRM